MTRCPPGSRCHLVLRSPAALRASPTSDFKSYLTHVVRAAQRAVLLKSRTLLDRPRNTLERLREINLPDIDTQNAKM